MTLSGPQIVCLRYAASTGVVHAWPLAIGDATIRRCRREGLLTTYIVSGVQMAQCTYGGHIEDELSDKGRRALAALDDHLRELGRRALALLTERDD